MKTLKLSLLALAAAVVMTWSGAVQTGPAYAAGPAAAPDSVSTGEITVNGTGYVNIVPDVAYITLGVNTQDASPKTAQTRNSQQVAAVIAAVKAMGIAEKDIKTTNFYMYPQYDYSGAKGVETVVGYTVSNSVTVTVRDIDQVGALLGAAADAGANISSGVQFGLLDSSAAYHKALALAMANASAKASVIAKNLNRTVGSPSSVTESGGMYAPVYSSAGANLAAMDAGASGVPVQAGELTVTANVQMVFEYLR